MQPPRALAAALTPAPICASPALQTDQELVPYRKHVLRNGLELVLHEDHSDPVVAVTVYYHVGSAREEPGRSGFAHLFEHMLFQGSEHVADNGHFKLIQEAGGALNGTTNQDRTNYFETLPARELELALWLESDRMGFLLPAMTQEKLDNQREVVKNERRQSYENRPYGLVHETILRELYPPEHPYSWPAIGSMRDLECATLEDVTGFFRRFYGPNNATLAIGGDIDPEATLALVDTYFGSLPRGPDVPPPAPRPALLSQEKRVALEDRVQLPQVTLTWPTVEAGHADEAALDLLADVLSANRGSILDRKLLVEEELASVVMVAHQAGELAGDLTVMLRPRPHVSLEQLERRVDELLACLVTEGPEGIKDQRLARLKARREGHFIRALETSAGRTDRLAHDNCFFGDPGRVRKDLERLRAVQADDVLRVAHRYVCEKPRVVVSVLPQGQLHLAAKRGVAADGEMAGVGEAATSLDRSRRPKSGPERALPELELWQQHFQSGVSVIGTPFTKVPLVRFSLAVPAGRLFVEQHEIGLAELTSRMLEEGTQDLSGPELDDELDALGADLSIEATDEEIVLRLGVLAQHTERAADILSALVLSPRFAERDFERVRRQLLVDIDTRSDHIGSVASDVFRRLVFGEGVAGAPPLGTRKAVSGLSVGDVRAFWRAHSAPTAARLAYVGPAGPEKSAKLFARLDESWANEAEARPRAAALPAGAERAKPTLFLVDRPGAKQSELRIGHLGVTRSHPDFQALLALNYALGGAFTSRINLNLREDKGYTYGARSQLRGNRSLGDFVVATAVHTEVTAPAVGEVLKELEKVRSGVSEEETEFVRRSLSQALVQAHESARAKLLLLEDVSLYGTRELPSQRLAWLRSMKAAHLSSLAVKHLRSRDLVILVVGDKERIVEHLRRLCLGEVVELDVAGREL